eukprot:jgi/Chlat1/2848/Chrsp194S08770
MASLNWRFLLVCLVVCAALLQQHAAAQEVKDVDVYDDVYMTGSCERDMKLFCKGVQPGESRLADCLTRQLHIEANGIDDNAVMLSEPCKTELHEFKVERAKDEAINTRLEHACKQDMKKYCNETVVQAGGIVRCLRPLKDKLSSACAKEVLLEMEDAADDFTLDPGLNKYCSDDAKALCPDVEPGEGRVQACLRDNRASLTWECQEELFRQEVEDADDIRLDAKLRKACMVDKNKFCPDVPPGDARVKNCLEDHREDPGFSVACKKEFEAMMERRVADFRLDPELTKYCEKDINELCAFEKESLDSVAGFDARVVECLQDYRDELSVPECKEEVHRVMKRAAEDVRFDEPLADYCWEDRERLCKDVPPGNARVLSCLQDQRDALSFECREALFDQEVRMSEDIDFKVPLKKACQREINKWCKDVPHGHARVINCLREKVGDVETSEECQLEIRRDEIMSAEDYRLNYRLSKACEADIDELCFTKCSPYMGSCGGLVLDCLVKNRKNLTIDACAKEVFELEKMQTEDWRNNAVLKHYCQMDVKIHCKNVEGGGAKVHRCLQDNLAQLSPECRNEELSLMIVQSEDVRLRPVMMKSCAGELKNYCKDVPYGGGRMFSCLTTYLGEVGFSSECEKEVIRTEHWRASNYHLDPAVERECPNDVAEFCAQEDASLKGNSTDPTQAMVLKCLVSHDEELSDTCSREVSRAAKLALWLYQPKIPLTEACDKDITDNCGKGKNRKAATAVGANMRCLVERVNKKQPVSAGCKVLLTAALAAIDRLEANPNVALHPGMELDDLAQKIESHLESRFGMMPSASGAVQLTGWLAIAAMASLLAVVVAGALYAFKRYTGRNALGYTLVVKGAKSGDV